MTYDDQRRQADRWLRKLAARYAKHSTQDLDELGRLLWAVAEADHRWWIEQGVLTRAEVDAAAETALVHLLGLA